MNIAYLPVFRDSSGAFGSPTSDSERTKLTVNTKDILIVIIDFNGTDPLIEAMEKTLLYLKDFTDTGNAQYSITV